LDLDHSSSIANTKRSTEELIFVNGAEANTFSISRSEAGVETVMGRRLLIRIDPRAQRFSHSVELIASSVWRA
jgi:hypothetical protein